MRKSNAIVRQLTNALIGYPFRARLSALPGCPSAANLYRSSIIVKAKPGK
jgi:hypothetical protein